MIDASRKSNVGKETEIVGVTINKLNEFLCISTKVDIVVELIRHRPAASIRKTLIVCQGKYPGRKK